MTNSPIDLSAAPSLTREGEATLPPPTPEEAAWLETLPPVMRQVAQRHGRRLYLLIVCGDSFNDAINKLMQMTGGAPGPATLLRVCAGAMGKVIAELEASIEGLDEGKFNEARLDIARAIALMGSVAPAGVAARQ